MCRLVAFVLFVVLVGWLRMACGGEPVLGKPLLEPGKVAVQPTELPMPRGPGFAANAYPRTSGSTSAEPLAVWIVCRVMGRECGWRGEAREERRLVPLRRGTDRALPIRERVHRALYAGLRHAGTHGAYKKLIEGDTDLIYECRLPSEDERKLMDARGIELDIRPIALDAFVFIRNKANPVRSLTLAQVRSIYTPGEEHRAKLGNWKEVGGPDLRIRPFTRNRNSGSQETMASLVMKGQPIFDYVRAGMVMTTPFDSVRDRKEGIGFTFLYYQRHMAPTGRALAASAVQHRQATVAKDRESVVEVLAINGVMPSRETVANGSYPLTTDVYVVTRKGLKATHPAAQLRDWLLTEEGQKIIGETGYVPLAEATPRKAGKD